MGFSKGAWLAALVMAGFAGGAARAADLVVGAAGGVWAQSLQKCVVEPWQKATGKTVAVTLGTASQWMNQIAAAPGKPPLDLMFAASETAFEAVARGLVDKFTVETVPNIAKLPALFSQIGDGYGVVHNYGAMGIIYNKGTVTAPPKTWKEFVAGTIAGKWKASMPNVNYPSGGLTISVWWFAKLFGGDVGNIEPGLAEIKRMHDSGNLVFWNDPNGVLNGLKSGDIDLALYWDGRAWAFINDGNAEFDYYSPEPGVVVAMTWIQKIKGGSELAYSFANQALSAASQSCFGTAILYGVANQEAVIDPKVAHEITDTKLLIFPPFKAIGPLTASWIEAWNKQIGR